MSAQHPFTGQIIQQPGVQTLKIFNSNSNFSDDCIYLFFVCTDKASGAWPENKNKCTKTFNACQGKLGLNITELKPDFITGFETSSVPTTSGSPDNEVTETTEATDNVNEVIIFFNVGSSKGSIFFGRLSPLFIHQQAFTI